MGSNRIMVVLAAIFGAVLLIAAPAAFAHHKSGHENGGQASTSDHDGDADSDGGTSYTEDTDTNDGTADGVADEGDNAHPSGNDKSVEHGGSGTQGKSESNPDDSKGPMRYEGELGDDKANGPGGTDLADQDGNNGCGNDDDFDDDNNGWCGKPSSGGGTPPPPPPPPPCCEDDDDDDDDEVLDDRVKRPSNGGDIVLDDRLERPSTGSGIGSEVLGTASGAALPFTGAALIPIAVLGLGLIGGGAALTRKRNR